MRYLMLFLVIIGLSSCAVVSKQYYYTPSVPHQTVKSHPAYFKMINSKVKISGLAGDSVGVISTSNGIGQSLLAGPPYLPVIPVGLVTMFDKNERQFVIDMSVRSNSGYFMSLAIDTADFKKTRDSLNARKIAKSANLNTGDCYMIINGSKKVPLHTSEFFMGSTAGHSYRLMADIPFRKVKTLRLVTGNPILDSTLKTIMYKRKYRITYCVMGFS
jgi:hypothetical protein